MAVKSVRDRRNIMTIDVQGKWRIVQSNGSIVEIHLDQDTGNPRLISGTGTTAGLPTGDVLKPDSTVINRDFFLVIDWHSGPVGEYHGTFGLNGTLTGVTFDRNNPVSQAFWHSDGRTFNIGQASP
jgi:hypothetical protein